MSKTSRLTVRERPVPAASTPGALPGFTVKAETLLVQTNDFRPPEVAIAIFDSSVAVGAAEAVYMRGQAQELASKDKLLRRALTLLGYPETILPAMAVTYQTINFHHYIVDAIIWLRVGSSPEQMILSSQYSV